MSREQLFAWAIRLLVPIAIVGQATTVLLVETQVRERHSAVTPHQVGPQTNDNPRPIFRCNGAGAGVVVSLGGDGSSVFVYCEDVKS